jgi:superfamily II DNA or RNA helicase
MPYFHDQYGAVSYPQATDAGPGLYNAQIGAVHALASHFTLDPRPAIVTMPTGSGKTAVLMMAPFLLKTRRVLIVTPSQFVRWQIADDFRQLQTLKAATVLPNDAPQPNLLELKTRIESEEAWEALRAYDVVVSTPNCTSPGYERIPPPPADLFDLVLFDEAHHSSAETWAELIESFPNIKRILFTATPFRRDRGEISGRFVYTYPVARAYQDGIFGQIQYVPVEPDAHQAANDIAIARRTQEVFNADHAAGFDHYVMVRTDRRTRAEALADIYRDNTNLRLAVIHSGISNTRVREALDALGQGELDGLICVSMLGEGFNFPKLKIAAIHSPHRSLEVTLQFIGRFARTNAADIGSAKFIGITSEMEIEGARLFETGAVWQDIITNLAHGRVENERDIRERLDEFQRAEEQDPTLEDLSLYSLYPRSHVKVYEVPEVIDLRQIADLSSDLSVVYRNVNQAGDVLILITRDRSRPKWSAGDKIVNAEYRLFVVHFDRAHQLLFINASQSIDGIYESLANRIEPRARTLPMSLIRRVVRGIENQRIFNIGMRNIQASNTAESYRIITGPNSQAAVKPGDSRLYRQGHTYLSGENEQGRVTIGYSSGSKVWAASSRQIPELLDWCAEIGEKIRTAGDVKTNSGLDYLSAGEVVRELPPDIVYVQWNKDAFQYEPSVEVEYVNRDGVAARCHILDVELRLAAVTREEATVEFVAEGLQYRVVFSLTDDQGGDEFYTPAPRENGEVRVAKGQGSVTLVQYLNEYYLDFFTASGALLSGNELFAPSDRFEPLDRRQIDTPDWAGTNIRAEITGDAAGASVHERIREQLVASPAEIVLYDHGTGEIADFVTLQRRDDRCLIALYHCKGSETPQPGARVEDVYEVCGQAQKSVATGSLPRLQARLRARRNRTRIIKGTADDLRTLLAAAQNLRPEFEIVVVQPGISKQQLNERLLEPLGATDGHLRSAGCAPLRIIASA